MSAPLGLFFISRWNLHVQFGTFIKIYMTLTSSMDYFARNTVLIKECCAWCVIMLLFVETLIFGDTFASKSFFPSSDINTCIIKKINLKLNSHVLKWYEIKLMCVKREILLIPICVWPISCRTLILNCLLVYDVHLSAVSRTWNGWHSASFASVHRWRLRGILLLLTVIFHRDSFLRNRCCICIIHQRLVLWMD